MCHVLALEGAPLWLTAAATLCLPERERSDRARDPSATVSGDRVVVTLGARAGIVEREHRLKK